MEVIILMSMLFLHWEENAKDKLYRHDYIMALVEHGFSWSFVVMLPLTALIIFGYISLCCINTWLFCLLLNTIIHTVVDNAKANVHCINLITDQVIHIAQVCITWGIMVYL